MQEEREGTARKAVPPLPPLTRAQRIAYGACLVPFLAILPFGPHVMASTAGDGISYNVAGFLGIAAGVALILRRRAAVELAAWFALWSLVALGSWRIVEPRAEALALVPIAATAWGIFRMRGTLRAARFPAGALGGSLRATAAMFLVLEAGAGLAMPFVAPHLLPDNLPRIVDPTPGPLGTFVEGRRTVATLGSSPANYERVHHRPFTAVLSERLGDRLNFLYYDQGGVDSELLVRVATGLLDGPRKPDAFLVYAGLQDWNLPESTFAPVAHARTVAQAGPVPRMMKWAIGHSELVRLSAWAAFRGQRQMARQVEPIFERFRGNLERILALAAERGTTVFAISLVIDRARYAEEAGAYVDRVNAYLATLPGRFPNVRFVDFAPRFREAFPAGAGADCSPFEPGSEAGQCGDPSHMGPKGHELLASVLEPVLRDWSEGR